MALRTTTWRAVLLAGCAVAVVVSSGCARFGIGAPPPEEVSALPAQASGELPLPAPDGTAIVAVLDPEVVKPKVSAEEAVALARASMADMVGESPSVQLVQMTGIEPNDGFTGWMILSTDIVVYPHQPHDPNASVQPTISTVATHTWVLVTTEGDVVMALQDGLDEPLPV